MQYRLGRRGWAFDLAFVYMIFFAIFLAKQPSYDWDMLAYMSVALQIEGTPAANLHDEVYGTINRSLPQGAIDNLEGRLTPEAVAAGSATTSMADPTLRQNWAAHTDSFLAQLPFYAVKPLYPALMALGQSVGLSLIDSGLTVSAIAYFGIGMLFYIWFTEWMPPLVAFGTMALLVLNPWLVVLARSIGPDILSICLLLWGAYAAIRGRPVISALIFLIAIPARPENIVYAGTFVLYLRLMRQLSTWLMIVLLAAVAGTYLLVSTLGANYGWKTLFYFVFINRQAVPGTAIPQIGLADYLMAYVGRLDRILLGQGELPVFLLIGYGALCLKISQRWSWEVLGDPYVHLLVLAALIAAVRMVVLPTEAFRALLPCYMLVTIVFVNACAQVAAQNKFTRQR